MNLVLNSKFRPFTYDEMVKPLVQYKEAYDNVYKEYSDLVTQTEELKDAVSGDTNSDAYKMYSAYSNELNSIVDDFSKGMNLNNRSALLGMKRKYSQNIVPISNAYNALKEANELRVKAGYDAIFQKGQYNSIDDFMHGKVANNTYTSRDALTKKTAAMTEAAMAEAVQDPEFISAMGDKFINIVQHTGGSYDDLKEALANSEAAQNRFAEIKRKVRDSIDYNSYDMQGRMNIDDAIDTGLFAGLDKPVRSIQANPDHMTPLQRAQMSAAYASAEHTRASTRLLDAQTNNLLSGKTKDGKNPGSSGGSDKRRVTVSSGAFTVNLKDPNDSRAIQTDERGKMVKGTRLSLNKFYDHTYKSKSGNEALVDRYHPLDNKAIDVTDDNSRLATLILRYTGESSLEDAFDKYDIYFNESGTFSKDYNLTFDPRRPETVGEGITTIADLLAPSLTGSDSAGSDDTTFDPNAVPE